MSVELFTVLMFASFFLLLALGVPLAFAAGGLAVLFGFILQGSSVFPWIILRSWHLAGLFSFIAIPLFVFMANMLRHSGIADDLYRAIYIWLGPIRGGLAAATVVVCTILAAMLGTVGGGVVIMGLIALPFMMKNNYSKGIALGSIIAGGSLGVLIPPSIQFIIYGTFASESIGKLFIGGIGPGLVLAGLYIGYILVRCWLQPEAGPALPKEERSLPFRQKVVHLRSLILPILLILTVLGLIYGGVATPSESAGIGAVGAMICAAIYRRLNWYNLKEAVYSTIKAVGMILWIIIATNAFAGVFQLAQGDKFISGLLLGLELGPWGILIVTQLIIIVLGMVLEPIGIIVLTLPIFLPLIVASGFDTLWFGIVYNVNLQIGFISPPFGYALFYLKGVTPKEISLTDIYRSAFPFMALQAIGLALIIMFPQIALWLPNLMK